MPPDCFRLLRSPVVPGPSALLGLLALTSLCFTACLTSPKTTLISRVKRAKVVNLAFYQNDARLVQDLVYEDSRYSQEMDEWTETLLLTSRVRMQGAPAGSVLANPLPSPEYAVKFAVGSSVYFYGEEFLEEYDLAKGVKRVTALSARTITAVSDENAIAFECSNGVSRVMRFADGKILFRNASQDPNSCINQNIITAADGWYLYETLDNFIRYRKITGNGVDSVVTTSDVPTGFLSVHGFGLLPYLDSGVDRKVPAYFDPDGRVSAALTRLKMIGIMTPDVLDIDQGRAIKNGELVDLKSALGIP